MQRGIGNKIMAGFHPYYFSPCSAEGGIVLGYRGRAGTVMETLLNKADMNTFGKIDNVMMILVTVCGSIKYSKTGHNYKEYSFY